MIELDKFWRPLAERLALLQVEDWEDCYERAGMGIPSAFVELALVIREHGFEDEALALLTHAAAENEGAAFYELGNYYFADAKSAEQLEQVLNYYTQGAQLGHADAMNNLADMYLNGEGTTVDYTQAFHWFERAASLGVVEAMFTLGLIHEQGLGVPVDETEAYKWYECSADEGYEEAQYRIGSIYFEGLLQVKQDYEQAFTWFMRAASQYQLDAIYNVGYCYEHGFGVEKSQHEAIRYYKQASLLGDYDAKINLATLYEDIDAVEAEKWRQAAENQRYEMN